MGLFLGITQAQGPSLLSKNTRKAHLSIWSFCPFISPSLRRLLLPRQRPTNGRQQLPASQEQKTHALTTYKPRPQPVMHQLWPHTHAISTSFINIFLFWWVSALTHFHLTLDLNYPFPNDSKSAGLSLLDTNQQAFGYFRVRFNG